MARRSTALAVRTVRTPAPVIRIAAPRAAPIRKRGHRRRRGGGGGRALGLADIAMAAAALEFLVTQIGSKLPVILASAGPEGTIALLAHFLKANKWVRGLEQVAAAVAVNNAVKSMMGSSGGSLFG